MIVFLITCFNIINTFEQPQSFIWMICIYSTLSCRFGIWKNCEALFLSVFIFLFFLLALIFWQWAESPWLCCSSAPPFLVPDSVCLASMEPVHGPGPCFYGRAESKPPVCDLKKPDQSTCHCSVRSSPTISPADCEDRGTVVPELQVRDTLTLRKYWMQYLSHMLWDYTRINVTQVSCILQLYLCDTWNCSLAVLDV